MFFNKKIFNFLSKEKLTILLFHKVPKISNTYEKSDLNLFDFEKKLEIVQKLFNIIPLEDAMLALEKQNLPPRSACITFDDGYADWMHGVVPVLEKRNAHATFFITTGQLKGYPLWNERILNSISLTTVENLDFKIFGLPEFNLLLPGAKESAIAQINSYVKYQKPDIKEHFLLELESQTFIFNENLSVMGFDDIRALHSKGFGIGAHSISHPILSQCDAKLAFEEIVGSREELISIIRAPVRSFAYPNGIPGKDFNLNHTEMLEKAGYSYGLTTHSGYVSKQTSRWEIPRFTPWEKSRTKVNLQFARNFLAKPHSLKDKKKSQHRVLMIAFHFPPQSGSSGIQRTLNFVKHLPLYGWKPTVLSAQRHAYFECSDDLLSSIPHETRVIRTFALDAAKHFSIKRKYPGLLAIPDRWSSWWLGGVFSGLKAIRSENPSVIWTTYPIATAHLIGATLNLVSGLPWVADFRDPMINGNYPSYPPQRNFWKWIETRAMDRASKCIFTTERAAQAYKKKYPSSAHKCMIIENGYDESVFLKIQEKNTDIKSRKFLMLHSGIIYPGDRDPSSFLLAIKNLLESNRIEINDIKVRFRAPQHEAELLNLVKQLKMEDVVEIAPSIAYSAAIAEMQSADLLLVFQGTNFNTQVPAKIYEYIRAGRSILALVDQEGDTAKKLKEFHGIHIADINSHKTIEYEIISWLENIDSPTELNDFKNNSLKISNFSREKQTELLGYIFSSVSER